MTKRAIKVLSVLLLIVILVSALSTSVYADNSDTAVNIVVEFYNNAVNITPREKDNNSSVYFYPETVTTHIGNLKPVHLLHVGAYGTNSSNGSFSVNCTQRESGGKCINAVYVSCVNGIEYGIYNNVNESKLQYAYLSIANGEQDYEVRTYLNGSWSPDSVGSLTPAA